jgi:hypothetical protein
MQVAGFAADRVGLIDTCRQSFTLPLLAGLTLRLLAARGKGALELVLCFLKGIFEGMF